MFNTIIIILLVITILTVLGYCVYMYLRDRTLEEIRKDVYQLFLQAEHIFTETESGKQKMKWVVGRARLLLPDFLQAFVSEELLHKVIQTWFDAVKDLLDDGKYNKSTEGTMHE